MIQSEKLALLDVHLPQYHCGFYNIFDKWKSGKSMTRASHTFSNFPFVENITKINAINRTILMWIKNF